MSKEAKQSIYNEYKEIWTSNPMACAIGYSNSNKLNFCVGLATNPKELVDVLNNRQCTGIVILTSNIDFKEYDVSTGTRTIGDQFASSTKSIPYGYYAEVMLEEGIDFEAFGSYSLYKQKLAHNMETVKTLLNFGLKRDIDAESVIYPSHMVEDLQIYTLTLTRGYITFHVTSESMAIKVGVDKYIVIHEPDLDVEFDFIVDMLARGLIVNPSEVATVLESL